MKMPAVNTRLKIMKPEARTIEVLNAAENPKFHFRPSLETDFHIVIPLEINISRQYCYMNLIG